MAVMFPQMAANAVEPADSFEAILTREYPRIHRLARRFGIAEPDLEDAAGEVLAKAWAYRGDFGNRASVSTWITRIAVNHFSTMLKRQRWRLAFISREEAPVPDRSNPRTMTQTKEAYELASRCIRTLPRKLREAFVLRYLEEMRYAEVADVLGITEGAARARAFEARIKLREMLREYEL